MPRELGLAQADASAGARPLPQAPGKAPSPTEACFRFQAFKAGPFLESYQPYHCRVTRASSDNQMAHLSFFFNPLPGSLQKDVFPSRAENFCLGNGGFPHHPALQKCPLIKFGGTEAKRKNLKKQQIFTGLANEIQVRFFFFLTLNGVSLGNGHPQAQEGHRSPKLLLLHCPLTATKTPP